MAGVARNQFGFATPSAGVGMAAGAQPSAVQSGYDTAGAVTKQQGQDYDSIMNKYRDLYDQVGPVGNQSFNFNANYTVPTYQSTSDYTNAIRNLSDLSKTGGYTDQNIADIRARGISPIRAVYANAQRNVDRQKSLQGGYSPNYAAVSAKMAREMSNQLSDATTNVNAQLAKDITANKIATAEPLASITAGEQSNRNNFSLDAAKMANQFALEKAQADLQGKELSYQIPIQAKLGALSGMNSLYGTTPAFAALESGNALNNASLQNQIQQGNARNNLALISQYAGV